MLGVTKVESVSAIEPRIAALPRAEAMHQPWNFGQAFRAEDLNFVFPDSGWGRGFGRHQTILNEGQFVPAEGSTNQGSGCEQWGWSEGEQICSYQTASAIVLLRHVRQLRGDRSLDQEEGPLHLPGADCGHRNASCGRH
jgi:hypothetical protein